jgi:hypothetical protein
MFCLRVTFQIIRHFHGNVVLQGVNFFIKPEAGIECAGSDKPGKLKYGRILLRKNAFIIEFIVILQ